jgi:two-component system copper resistance phosphate regulon response regulator CusR
MPRVLVIEDERKVRRGLEEGLAAAGFEVEAAATGDEGARLGRGGRFDVVLLDWMLPGMDGLEVLHALRSAGQSMPVLLLTARDAIDDRVTGLDAGADDYLVKPFAFAELLARLRVLLRRGQPERETVLRAAGLEIDLLRRRVTRGGAEVPLTHREFALLEYLARHKGQAVTREMLGRDVWDDPSYALTNVVEVYVNLLRKKIDPAGGPSAVTTLRGVGYRLEE